VSPRGQFGTLSARDLTLRDAAEDATALRVLGM